MRTPASRACFTDRPRRVLECTPCTSRLSERRPNRGRQLTRRSSGRPAGPAAADRPVVRPQTYPHATKTRLERWLPMSQIVFDERTAQQLEVMYRKRDALRRRRLVREALAVEAGHRVLDVGCGPGFYSAELLAEVGAKGAVVGVDTSAAMLAAAARRCEGLGDAAFHEGNATSLPVEDRGFDRALCVQVLEYVADVPAALAELYRVLRPRGRALVWDVDWSTLSWHSADPERMQRMLRAWDRHLAHPALSRTLAAVLRAAGFTEIRAEGHAFATTELDPET